MRSASVPESTSQDEPAPGATRADECSVTGLDLLSKGDASGAAVAFRQAIALDAAHIEARHGLIRALRDAEAFDEAVNAAIELTELTPLDPLAFASLSIALQKAGKIPEAEAAAARARVLEWKQQLAEPLDQDGTRFSSLEEAG